MPNTYKYRLAVQGKSNLTPIGRTYTTLREARDDAARVNAERKRDGLKEAVAIKEYRAGRWQFVEWIEDEDYPPSIETINYDARMYIKAHPRKLTTADKIAETMETLEWEAQHPSARLTMDQREAAQIAYDEWRYLLHSVDGLNA